MPKRHLRTGKTDENGKYGIRFRVRTAEDKNKGAGTL